MKGIKIRNAKITSVNTKAFGRYLNEIQAIPLLTKDEELVIGKRAFEGDTGAKEKLVRHNLRFVISVANMYANEANPLEDLVAVGNLGLVEAANEFNPERGVRFISFAVWKIRGQIFNSIQNNGRTIRISRNKLDEITKLHKQTLQLEQELERTPQAEELVQRYAEDLAIKPHKSAKYSKEEVIVKEYNFLHQTFKAIPESLQQRVNDENDNILADTIPDTTFKNQDELLIQDEFKTKIYKHLDKLKANQKTVILGLYGLNNGDIKTYDEIGIELGVTRQRIQQIHYRALAKLKEIITQYN